MLWSQKLNEWKNGVPLKYPSKLNRFFYITTPIYKDFDSEYKEKFIPSKKLDKLRQDYSPYIKYIQSEKKNKYATSFYNLDRTTILIIPIPKRNKNFTTIKDFIDNASKTQQKFFWKKVYSVIKKTMKKTKDKLYISTHGLGVPFFHLRLETNPKYRKYL